jgi:hypothetical protein
MGVQGVKAKAPVEEVAKYFTKAVHRERTVQMRRQRRIKSATGGQWYPATVLRLRERLA